MNPNWNITVISITILLSVMLSIFVLSDPDSTSKILLNIYSKLSKLFEEIFIYGGAFLLLFLLGIAISKYGSIKVNMPNKPIYSIYSWCSMLFAAGIGATILYWSTIEWIDYYNILKSDNLLIDYDSLLYARTYPIFHWGFTAWAIYCLPVIAFTLAITKNPNSNLTFSGILNINNFILRSILDVLFIGSIICAAGVGLGLSFPLISSVISEIFSIERNYILDISTILLCSIIFATSAYVGVQRGIKKLSNINIIFLVIFLFLILILGPTNYIIANSFETVTFYLANYINISLTTGTTISLDWTVFYWAWWFALAPMVGTFLVNISNGKTLREIIFGTILMGSLGCTLCMLILSNLSIFLFETSIIDSPNIIENSLLSREALVVNTIASLNFGNYLLIGFVIILIIFLCTTYDSASYVLAAASMKSASVSSSKSLRLLYAILLVIQPTLLMYLNGIDSFKWIMVIFSVPLLLINLLLIFSIIKNVYRFK
jgi:BCCT family betaine/carnitine transporter